MAFPFTVTVTLGESDHVEEEEYDGSVRMYQDSVRAQAILMQREIYHELKKACLAMKY
jgi:hypothetical protein